MPSERESWHAGSGEHHCLPYTAGHAGWGKLNREEIDKGLRLDQMRPSAE